MTAGAETATGRRARAQERAEDARPRRRKLRRLLLLGLAVFPLHLLLVLALAMRSSSLSGAPATPSPGPGTAAQLAAAKIAPGQAGTGPAALTGVTYLALAPAIEAGVPAPHGNRGPCLACHRILPARAARAAGASVAMLWGDGVAARTAPPPPSPPAPGATKAGSGSPPAVEWQGMRLGSTPVSLAGLGSGLLVQGVSARAALAGAAPGDLLVSVNGEPTPDLRSLVAAASASGAAGGLRLGLLRRGELVIVEQSGSLTRPRPQSAAPLPAAWTSPRCRAARLTGGAAGSAPARGGGGG